MNSSSLRLLVALTGVLSVWDTRAQGVDEYIAAHETGQRSEQDEARTQFSLWRKSSRPNLTRVP